MGIFRKASMPFLQRSQRKRKKEKEAKPTRITAQKQQLSMKISLFSCPVTQLFWVVIKVISSSCFTIPYSNWESRTLGMEILLKMLGIPHLQWQLWQAFQPVRHCWQLLGKQTHKEAGFFTNPEEYLGKKNKKLNGQKECNFRVSSSADIYIS